jgi:hypothetical protein
MNGLFALLTLQAVLGAFDNLWHHEITERLPAKRAARSELALHAVREALYGFLFIGLAWYAWHGAWALLIGAVVLVEIVVTLADFVVEDRTRRLPSSERVLHTVLAISIGAVLVSLWGVLAQWFVLPTEIAATNYGGMSWLLTVFGIGASLWALRTGIAALRHFAPPEWVREPLERGAAPTGRVALVSGATGFIGGHLVRKLIARGDTVWVWTRDADRALERFGPHVRVVTELSSLANDARIHAIVHLAGAPVFGMPWTAKRRQQLVASRVETAQALLDLCGRLTQPPRVWVGASAIGFYGVRDDEWLTERAPPSEGFQSQLCESVEVATQAAATLGMRVVMLRIGLVLGNGGVLPRLALPTRWALGAVLGRGDHWVSWIHVGDLTRVALFAIDTPHLAGPVNAVAPRPVRQQAFQCSLARVLHRPQWLRVPAAPLRWLLGDMAQLLVDGQRVYPARLIAERFQFRFVTVTAALRDLLVPETHSLTVAPASSSCEVYFNAECPVCNFEMTHYAKRLAGEHRDGTTIRFVDGPRDAERLQACGLRPEHLESRLYLRDERGRITSGFEALLSLWERMPGYRQAARILGVPLLRAMGSALYDHVVAPTLTRWARHRAARVAH